MAVVDNQEVTRIAKLPIFVTSYQIIVKQMWYQHNYHSSLNLQQSIKSAAVSDEILRIQDNRCTSTPNSSVWYYQILKTKQAYNDSFF
jgi:hypothetical protein